MCLLDTHGLIDGQIGVADTPPFSLLVMENFKLTICDKLYEGGRLANIGPSVLCFRETHSEHVANGVRNTSRDLRVMSALTTVLSLMFDQGRHQRERNHQILCWP